MRKFSLVLLALLVVTTAAFAQTYSPVVEFEAEAKATFGVNLEANGGPATGFALSNSADLSITFIAEDTAEFGSGEVYGWLEVEDFEIVLEASETGIPVLAGTAGEVSAKLFLGPAYIVIATAGNEVDVAGTNNTITSSILGLTDQISLANEGVSVAIGFAVPDLMTIEAVIASDPVWHENENNSYKLALLTETTVAGATITLDAATWINRTNAVDATETDDFGEDAAVGVGLEYDLDMDGMVVTPFVGFDLKSVMGVMSWEVIGGVNIDLGGQDDDEDIIAFEGEFSGVSVEGGFVSLSDGDASNWFVRLGFFDAPGDDGFLPVVGAALLMELKGDDDANNGLGFGLGAEVKADLGTLVPYFGVMLANEDMEIDDNMGLTIAVGTDIKVIDNVTFNIDYRSGDLLLDGDGTFAADDYYAFDAATGSVGTKAGRILISTKIAY